MWNSGGVEDTQQQAPSSRDGGTWRGASRSERDASRRMKLLEAGLELFGTAGYAPTTVQELCREAGVSSRSFYDYFSGREQVLRTLYVEATEKMKRRVSALPIEPETPVAEVIRRGVAAGIGPMLEDERLGRVVEIEAVGVSRDLEACRRSQIAGIARAIEDLLAELMRDGRVPVFEPGMVGLMVVGGMTEALVAHLSAPLEERLPSTEFISGIAWVIGRLAGH